MANKPLSLCCILCICFRIFHSLTALSYYDFVLCFINFLYSFTLQQTVKVSTLLNRHYVFTYYLTLSYLFQPDLAWHRNFYHWIHWESSWALVRFWSDCVCMDQLPQQVLKWWNMYHKTFYCMEREHALEIRTVGWKWEFLTSPGFPVYSLFL